MKPHLSDTIFYKSQVFIAICAAGLGSETYLISGTPIDFVTVGIIFFAALFIYNASKLNISVFKKLNGTRQALQVEGNNLSLSICVASLIILFGLLTACNWLQVLVFMGTSLLSLFYMMPFKKNGVRIQGLRNNLLLKNVILSLTWASATVLFPICLYKFYLTDKELIFMCCRRFFFIYALTVIYDLRDLEADSKAGMHTIALRFGENITKMWSLVALLMFVIFIYTDPSLSTSNTHALSKALLLSAVAAALITLNTHRIRKKSYYALIVDSPMALQFLLVLLFKQL